MVGELVTTPFLKNVPRRFSYFGIVVKKCLIVPGTHYV